MSAQKVMALITSADGARLPQPQRNRAPEQRWTVTQSVRMHSYLLRVGVPAHRQMPENCDGQSGRPCRIRCFFYPRIPELKLRAVFGCRFAAEESPKNALENWEADSIISQNNCEHYIPPRKHPVAGCAWNCFSSITGCGCGRCQQHKLAGRNL